MIETIEYWRWLAMEWKWLAEEWKLQAKGWILNKKRGMSKWSCLRFVHTEENGSTCP